MWRNVPPSSKQHFRESHYEVRFLAKGSNGETYLAIKMSVLNTICEEFNEQKSIDKLCTGLRDNLVVVKFHKEDGGLDRRDLRDEINFLRSMPQGRPEITSLINFQMEGPCQWFTTKFIPAGTLHDLVRDTAKAVHVGLQYHFALEIVKALALVHFQVTDFATMAPQTRRVISHGDIHGGNLLVRPTDTEYGMDIVLADFGRAQQPLTGSTNEDSLRRTRCDDYRNLGYLMEGIFIAARIGTAGKACEHRAGPNIDCQNCIRVAGRYGLLPYLEPEEKELQEWAYKFKVLSLTDDKELFEFLKAFVAEAQTLRARHWKPINNIKGHLKDQGLSRKDLLRIVGLDRY